MRRDQIFSLIILLTLIGIIAVTFVSIDTSSWIFGSRILETSLPIGAPGDESGPSIRYGAVKVVDGDTIIVSGLYDSIRLIGIDAPETNDRRVRVKCLADIATLRLKELVYGKEVLLIRDIEDKDKYGRYLRYVYLPDETFINLLMIKEGYAKILTIPPNMRFAPLFLAAQQEARRLDRGLWNSAVCAEGL